MTGTWHLTVDKPPMVGRAGMTAPKIMTFVLKQEGEKIIGTIKDAAGKPEVTGTIQGSNFELSSSAVWGITLRGKVEGKKISGSIVYKEVPVRDPYR